eukprot:TRINITY_DN9623_c0_g1_i1.p1 TRINITY_DN9623_c0_g1~~TRINITY_DN9623_c0_g1_i1.p1  ORF type:complete len:158 (+),score=67.50 TRINITY_DN9623_c0_g1_i1:99-572(+)
MFMNLLKSSAIKPNASLANKRITKSAFAPHYSSKIVNKSVFTRDYSAGVLYFGNLPWSLTENDLRNQVSEFGAVERVSMPLDRETGRPRGFAFVDFEDNESLQRVLSEFNGKNIGGRTLRVSPGEERSSGSFGRGNRGGERGGDRPPRRPRNEENDD